MILGISLLSLVIYWLSGLSLGETPLSQNILIPWVTPPPIESLLLSPQPMTPPYQSDSLLYIPMSPEYHLASLAPPPLSPLIGHPLLESPSITSPLDLSLEDIQRMCYRHEEPCDDKELPEVRVESNSDSNSDTWDVDVENDRSSVTKVKSESYVISHNTISVHLCLPHAILPILTCSDQPL